MSINPRGDGTAKGRRRAQTPKYVDGNGPSLFSSWLKTTPPTPRPLAWCHTTEAYIFRRIIASGEFRPSECKVFGGPLSYFFYGRPAYRHSRRESMRTQAFAPVVIIFDPSLQKYRKRLFPFDTGAFHDRRYARWMHPDMHLQHFELTHLPDAPQRYVAALYGSNRDYLDLKPCVPSAPCDGNFEADAVITMLRDLDATPADDRKLTLEMQIQEAIPFSPPFVKGLILPRTLARVSYVDKFLTGLGADIDVRLYDASPLKLASDYQALLEREALNLQASWGLV